MNNNLTLSQQLAAYASTSVVVTAGAGTGKTHLLTERYLYYLRERDLSPLEIVAVTFTEKAATELRSRIRSLAIQQLPQRSDILAELEAAQISTIHALASRICQEHSEIVGLPLDFTVIDDLEGKIWLDDAIATALSHLPPQFYDLIPYSLMSSSISALLADPYTAEKALQQGIGDWSTVVRYARRNALKRLVNDPIWQQSGAVFEQCQGKAGDKLEILRQTATEAMENLEDEENIDEAIASLAQMAVRGGSQKNWQDGELTLVKNALVSLRDLIKVTIKAGLINLKLGEADEQLQNLLPALGEAYREVSDYLANLKQQAKILTFSDLEIYALTALQHPQVQNYYRQRWQVFLVDEFQDTNPTQGNLLEVLSQTAQLTIVGDMKQSIYGFRRADLRVFKQFSRQILDNQGQEVLLHQSFRTHQPLISQINQIFAPLLADLHQDLTSDRATAPHQDNSPQIEVWAVEPNSDSSKSQRRRIEADFLAQKLKQLLEQQIPVYDKQTKQLRPVEPKDIAILTRTWSPLNYYEEALAAAGIPVAPSGGGNLLATREAKDAWALLRFVSDPLDQIALVAVLRSPWFAISDRILAQLAIKTDTNQIDWWDKIKSAQLPELAHPVQVLTQLLQQRDQESPSRLLQIADRYTGYTAVIANLPGAKRRLADWQGFRELVRDLEQGTNDLFGVVRRLKRFADREVEIPRPPIETGNAVSLMTIFAAKGLEWSIVAIADLSRKHRHLSESIYFDPDWGVAFQWEDTQGETQTPVLYTYLQDLQHQRESEEELRILYVALTRARDYLILTATEPNDGSLAQLSLGLTAANIPITTIPFVAEKTLPPLLPTPSPPQILPPLLINGVGSGISELPVTALSEYNRCPLRFYFHFIEGHPGIGEGIAYAMQVGTLVHKALEQDLTTIEHLDAFADPSWSRTAIAEAMDLAHRFRQVSEYQYFSQTAIAKEKKITLQLSQITLTGVIDLVGENWVLDYKSDRDINPQDHRFQLWAYAQALEYQQAHIAYLRHDYLHSFSSAELNLISEEVEQLINQIMVGNYHPNPVAKNCQICPYVSLCEFATLEE